MSREESEPTPFKDRLAQAQKDKAAFEEATDSIDASTRNWLAIFVFSVYATTLGIELLVMFLAAYCGEITMKEAAVSIGEVFKSAVLPLTTLVVGYYMAKH